MVKLLHEGFTLNFKTPELAHLFKKTKKILEWTLEAIHLIQEFDDEYKSTILLDEHILQVNDIHSKIKKNISNNYKHLILLVTDKPSEDFDSDELRALK